MWRVVVAHDDARGGLIVGLYGRPTTMVCTPQILKSGPDCNAYIQLVLNSTTHFRPRRHTRPTQSPPPTTLLHPQASTPRPCIPPQMTLNMFLLVSLPIVPSRWLPPMAWSPPPKRASNFAIPSASRSAWVSLCAAEGVLSCDEA